MSYPEGPALRGTPNSEPYIVKEWRRSLKKEFTLIHSDAFFTDTGRKFNTFGVCWDYNKHSNSTGRGEKVTGMSLYINNTDYAVIDVDIKVEDETIKDNISEDFEDALKTVNVKLVETRSGGLHIYCRWDGSFKSTSGRVRRAYVDESGRYVIDLFTPGAPGKANLVLLPGSKARGRDDDIKGRYEWIRHCPDDELSSLADVMKALKDWELIH